MKSAAIFDLDGTLCTIGAKRESIIAQAKMPGANQSQLWLEFHKLGCAEAPITMTLLIAKVLKEEYGLHIVILTGRSVEFKQQTKGWLKHNLMPYDELIMRQVEDFRSSVVMKKEALRCLMECFHIAVAFDDRESNLEVFRNAGIMTICIPRIKYGK